LLRNLLDRRAANGAEVSRRLLRNLLDRREPATVAKTSTPTMVEEVALATVSRP
jgi:hypothetical protein